MTIGTCDCCGYENIGVKPYTSMREADIRNNHGPSTANLCLICASTYIGTMWGFPTHQGPGTLYLAQSLAWIANHLTREAKEDA